MTFVKKKNELSSDFFSAQHPDCFKILRIKFVPQKSEEKNPKHKYFKDGPNRLLYLSGWPVVVYNIQHLFSAYESICFFNGTRFNHI